MFVAFCGSRFGLFALTPLLCSRVAFSVKLSAPGGFSEFAKAT